MSRESDGLHYMEDGVMEKLEITQGTFISQCPCLAVIIIISCPLDTFRYCLIDFPPQRSGEKKMNKKCHRGDL